MRRADLDNLEALLRYFNVACASAVAGMDADKRVLMLANVACVASEALLSCKRTGVTTDVLLNAAAPYYAELCEHLGKGKKPPGSSETWIKFSAVAEHTGGGGDDEVDPGLLLPSVVRYDETGAPNAGARNKDGEREYAFAVRDDSLEGVVAVARGTAAGRERRRSRCCNAGATESPLQREDCRSTRRRRNEPGEQAEGSDGD